VSGCFALIVAAGRGRRFGGELPKQYRRLGGVALLRHAAATFDAHPAIDGVLTVIHPDDQALYDEAVAGLDLLEPVNGGDTRQDSVRNGLLSLAARNPDSVMIHDAARPFITGIVISAAHAALADAPGALVAVPVVDTLKRGSNGRIGATVDREDLWRAQTPQAFRFPEVLAAHDALAGHGLTDDAAVAEAAGLEIVLIPGEEENFKVTTEADLTRAEAILSLRGGGLLPRTGQGFDVHAFGPGDHVWLCGVKIPHDRGLIGHSDADVGLHAITDAVLGALGDGDIGSHFSDKDPRWKGAASDQFLRHALSLIAARGGRLLHIDLTLICEAPRIRPHHDAMTARLSEITGLPRTAVSVKATTTERLGFTGRGEGMVGQALATVLLPADPA
jgi:2-C-methyl-D-erythritol 4-phosphate cytidylyltransferase/2-C-methyl-D-erythritol 2,4-cyclodiphosphate synthase